MATFTFEEQRVIIQFLHLRGMKPIDLDCMWLCLYPQDCIRIWIYRMQLNYITLQYSVEVENHVKILSMWPDIHMVWYGYW